MMSLNTKLKNFLLNLVAVDENVFHYFRPISPQAPFIVWAETGESDSFFSGNQKTEQQLQIVVDFFTLTEFDPLIDSIQTMFNSNEYSWSLNSVQYEDQTNLIHYEWTVNIG